MPTKKESLLSINQASKSLSVTEKTLRRWEAKGFLIPIRTSGGHRRYYSSQIENIKRKKGKKRITKNLIAKTWIDDSEIITAYKTQLLRSDTKKLQEKITNKAIQKEPLLTPLQTKTVLEDIYKFTPKIYKKILWVYLSTFMLLISVYFSSRHLPEIRSKYKIADYAVRKTMQVLPFIGNNMQNNNDFISDQDNLETKPTSTVLAATSFNNVSFKVNVESFFAEDSNFSGNIAANGGSITTSSDSFDLVNLNATTLNIGGAASTVSIGATTGTTSVNNILNVVGNIITTPGDLTLDAGGGAVSVGTGTPEIIDLADDDLYITGDLELDGSLVVGSDSVNDLTGTGLQVSSGSLQTTLGTSIESSEIIDDTIKEVDLNVSNSPTNAYVLTYNSSTSGFTWAVDQTGGTNLWTDGGAITYLTSTTDDLAFGGTDSTAPFFFDVSTGNLTLDSLTTDSGGVTIASGQDLTIGTIGLNDTGTGPTNSGASLVGTFDEFANSSSSNVQDVLDDLDAAIGSGASKWTQDTGFVYLTNTTDSVTVGGTTELGKLAVDGDANEIQLLVQGNSTQSTNLVVFENSTGTDLLTVDNSGNLTLAGSITVNSEAISDFSGNGLQVSSGLLTIDLTSATDALSSTTSSSSGLE